MEYVLIVCGWSGLSCGFNTMGHFLRCVESKVWGRDQQSDFTYLIFSEVQEILPVAQWTESSKVHNRSSSHGYLSLVLFTLVF